ncbi:epithelial membrane protein 2-like isoform X3 [Betta splendens]|uniref:Epithelial membrane protein 1 n=1 Tax=Betta splendens TaxID=158456 RepID=A0A9W2XYP1_BETSP|nr:epithelial membrane protein 2-like isoform X3 [Betta splendens]
MENGPNPVIRTVTMLILLAVIFAVHIIGIVLLLVATIDNAWWMTQNVSTDVWFRWVQQGGVWNHTDLPSGTSYPQEYLQAVQACSVLACIFSILGVFVFVAQLFTLEKGQRFTISGVFQFIACLCIMVAASIYTDRFHLNENGWYGHSFILAWISFGLTFISSIIYFVLRKKTA